MFTKALKRASLLGAAVLFSIAVQAQEVKFPALDTSPADFAYFPANAAFLKKGDNTPPQIRVIYSRPSLKGRVAFGQLEPFGKVWRVGANESTQIRFYKTVSVGNKEIPAGEYSLFAIPGKESWVVIINQQTDRWGAYTYDESKDIVKVTVPVKKLSTPLETLGITFTPAPAGANLIIGWDTTSVEVPVTIK